MQICEILQRNITLEGGLSRKCDYNPPPATAATLTQEMFGQGEILLVEIFSHQPMKLEHYPHTTFKLQN